VTAIGEKILEHNAKYQRRRHGKAAEDEEAEQKTGQ